MKTISIREMKANWAQVERQVRHGESITVLNRGRPTVRLSPAAPAEVVVWDDHLAKAARPLKEGLTAEKAIRRDRDARW